MLRFNANLFRLAFTCASNEETRYYLKGVFVEPHAQGGVTLTATDGHRLICIRDENGQADEKAIVCLGDALKLCRAKSHELREVVIQTGSNDATLFCRFAESDESTARPIGAAYGVRVDGTYPDYQRVVPQEFTSEGAPGFQGRYIAAFGDLACEFAAHIGQKPSKHDSSISGRADVLRVFCGDSKYPEGSPALVIFPAVEFAFGILMPCRVASDIKPDVPAWFRATAAAPALAPAAAELATENA